GHLGLNDRKLWLASNWASVGHSAGGPGVGVVVVWRHHVGIITGRSGDGWVIKSGNDGHAVRERVRSIAGAIAFRRRGWRLRVRSLTKRGRGLPAPAPAERAKALLRREGRRVARLERLLAAALAIVVLVLVRSRARIAAVQRRIGLLRHER